MPICRLFNSPSDAQSAADDLARAGFGPGYTALVESASGFVSAKSLVKKGIQKNHAESYADAIRQGGTLVIVDGPLGFAKRATEVLAKASPGEAGATETQYEGDLWDDGTPASSALSIPVLIDSNTTFSSWFGLSLLSRKQTANSSFGLPLLSRKQSPNSTFGFPLLSKNQTAKSTFGIPLLTKSR